MNVLKKYHIHVAGPIFDDQVADYILRPTQRHGLDFLAETYLNYRTLPPVSTAGAASKYPLVVREPEIALLANYACEYVDTVVRLKTIFEKELANDPQKHLLYEIDLPLVPVLADMEATGVRLDTKALKESSAELDQTLRIIERKIFQLAGQRFNVSSPRVVGEILFEHLRIGDSHRKTKTGQYSTDEAVLETLKGKHPIIGQILDFRRLKKLLSTYIDALPGLVHPEDGKIHTTYNQANTSTGRLSSNNPNLQNIPVRGEQGKEIRRAFIPEPDCIFLSADYSQIELRIIAHQSHDQNMIDAFNNRQDIHAAMAAKIYHVSPDRVTEAMRRTAKTANFGIIYGISNFGLAEQLHIPRNEAKDLINEYFAAFPDLKAHLERSVETARKQGYVETIFGRRHPVPDIHSQNGTVRGYAERYAINAPVQGSAADIIKVAMNRIFGRFNAVGLRSKMILQVHDELNFNVYPEELDRVREIVVWEMEHAVELLIPLVANCGTGSNWLEAH
jgi:DNA polymerase-1